MQKHKHKGLTLLHLLVVIAVIAVVTTLSVPTFANLRAAQQFREEARELLDQFSEIRTNALAGIACADDDPAESWGFTLDIDSGSVVFQPMCDEVDFGDPTTYPPAFLTAQSFETTQTLISTATTVKVTFFVDTYQVRIEDLDNGTAPRKNAMHLVIQQTDATSRVKSICLDRVGGFFTFTDNDTCTP